MPHTSLLQLQGIPAFTLLPLGEALLLSECLEFMSMHRGLHTLRPQGELHIGGLEMVLLHSNPLQPQMQYLNSSHR
jgi:hypothetical protein